MSYAAIATTTIVFVFTCKIILSLGVGDVEVVAKVMCYYMHERLLSFISFGKKEHLLSSLPVERPLNEQDMQTIKDKLQELGYIHED
ncbi:MAG TPA: DUF2061 domain-containing protein [Planctomycetes bacterium]|nr:DUF2061 domain-containing protein [Planctomycetota bacterium]